MEVIFAVLFLVGCVYVFWVILSSIWIFLFSPPVLQYQVPPINTMPCNYYGEGVNHYERNRRLLAGSQSYVSSGSTLSRRTGAAYSREDENRKYIFKKILIEGMGQDGDDPILLNAPDINKIAEVMMLNRRAQFHREYNSSLYQGVLTKPKEFVQIVRRNKKFIEECLDVLNVETTLIYTKAKFLTKLIPNDLHTAVISLTNRNQNARYVITGIRRVHNPFLLLHYELKKLQHKKQYSFCSERFMFHGSTRSNILKICSNNFDWRLNGTSTGCKFGRGVAFSPLFSYAAHYGDESFERVMILAKFMRSVPAVVGDHTTVLPPEDFDTTTNGKNSVYVKYDDNTFLPMYIIDYLDI